MKRLFMVSMIGLAFFFAAPALAQPLAGPAAGDAAASSVQAAPADEKEKQDPPKRKMTKRTKKQDAGENGLMPVVR